MLLGLIIVIAFMAGGFLLALVSEEFAYALSRVVEGARDFVEYKAALRQARTQARHAPTERAPYKAAAYLRVA